MDIDPIQPSTTPPVPAQEPVRGQDPIARIHASQQMGVALDTAATPADRIEISDASRELARALHEVAAAPDARADRIAELRQQIEQGIYLVPAELVAQRLLQSQPEQGS